MLSSCRADLALIKDPNELLNKFLLLRVLTHTALPLIHAAASLGTYSVVPLLQLGLEMILQMIYPEMPSAAPQCLAA